MPSVVTRLAPENTALPKTFDHLDETTIYMQHFMDNLDVTIFRSAITEQGRFLIGNAAVRSQLPLQSFDVNDFAGKSEDDLALILTLSMIAGKTVKDAYEHEENLGNPLQFTVNMATA